MKNTKKTLALGMTLLVSAAWAAAELADIPLPAPRIEGGRPLMQILKERRSERAFSARPLPVEALSDLLWAAFGINRPDSGQRTAPSAMNWQEMEIYAVLEGGAYLYDAKANSLNAVAEGDLRRLTGIQDFVMTAPLNLVFVADTTRMRGAAPEDQARYAWADAGFISQNVYLFCASEGLSTVVRGLVDRDALARALDLPEHKKIILTQTVGYPATETP